MPLLKVYGGKELFVLHKNLLAAVATLGFKEHVAIVHVTSEVFDWQGDPQNAFIQIECSDNRKLESLVVALLPLGVDLETSPLGQYFMSNDYKAAWGQMRMLQASHSMSNSSLKLGLLRHEAYGFPAGKVLVYVQNDADPNHVLLVTPTAKVGELTFVSEHPTYKPDCLLELPESQSLAEMLKVAYKGQ